MGSLLLGLYDEEGLLDHVGFTSAITDDERAALTRKLEKLRGGPGFTGDAPGGPSRWATERSAQWEPLKPKLVVEVQYDHVTGDRFRHGTRLPALAARQGAATMHLRAVAARGGPLAPDAQDLRLAQAVRIRSARRRSRCAQPISNTVSTIVSVETAAIVGSIGKAQVVPHAARQRDGAGARQEQRHDQLVERGDEGEQRADQHAGPDQRQRHLEESRARAWRRG